MLCKTRGIALHTVSFSETSLIVRIYTEAFGLSSYMVKGSKSQRSKMRPVFFQPLTLLELDVYHRGRATLQTIKELRILEPYHAIPSDIRKSSIALFLDELVYKSVKEEESNPALFEFLWNAFMILDRSGPNIPAFHLVFALKLSKFLGFMPSPGYTIERPLFNLREGVFQNTVQTPEEALDKSLSDLFSRLLQSPLDDITFPAVSLETRNELLEKILLYYRIHIPGFQEILSHKVLHSVLA